MKIGAPVTEAALERSRLSSTVINEGSPGLKDRSPGLKDTSLNKSHLSREQGGREVREESAQAREISLKNLETNSSREEQEIELGEEEQEGQLDVEGELEDEGSSEPTIEEGSFKNEEELRQVCSPLQKIISSPRRFFKNSLVVPSKDHIKVIEEYLVVSVESNNRKILRHSPSSGIVSYKPSLTFSFPESSTR